MLYHDGRVKLWGKKKITKQVDKNARIALKSMDFHEDKTQWFFIERKILFLRQIRFFYANSS